MTAMYADIETTVSGIPCLVRPTRVFVQKPMGPSADSDWDCYGYSQIYFDVLDRRGRPAPWLERKLTGKEISRIENEILESIETDE
jgi:hypothetical protein